MSLSSMPSGNTTTVRAVEFFIPPGAPAQETKNITTFSLMYRLPFTSTLLIYDDEIKEFVTKTFKPGDLTPQNDLVNTNTLSADYNAFRIQDYINRSIFSPITLTIASGTTPGGVTSGSLDIAALYVWTDAQLSDVNMQPWKTSRYSEGWYKTNFIYVTEAFVSDGTRASIVEYDLLQSSVTPNSIGFDEAGLDYSNPVIDNLGIAYCMGLYNYTTADVVPVNVTHWGLGTCPAGGQDTMLFKQDLNNMSNPFINLPPEDLINALLVDANDNLFFIATSGVYKIQNAGSYSAVKIYDTTGMVTSGGWLDIQTGNIFLLVSLNGQFTIIEMNQSGNIVNQADLQLTGPVESVSTTFNKVMVTDQGEVIDINFPTSTPLTIMRNQLDTFEPFVDGDLATGQISWTPVKMVINYDIHETFLDGIGAQYGETYFLDVKRYPQA